MRLQRVSSSWENPRLGNDAFLSSIADAVSAEADESPVEGVDGAENAPEMLMEDPKPGDGVEPGGDPEDSGKIVVAGREFASIDDLVKQFDEDHRYIGTLKNEIGDLRKFREEVEPLLQSQQDSAAPVPTSGQIDAYFAEAASTNPTSAYNEAVQAYNEALGMGDTKLARAVIRSVRKHIDESAADEMQDVLDDYRMQQVAAPAMQNMYEQTIEHAWSDTLAAKPDAANYAQQIQEIIGSGVINTGDGGREALKRAALAAYEIALARDTDRVVQQRIEAERATEGDQAAASALSGTRAVPDEGDDAALEADEIFAGILNARNIPRSATPRR